MRLKGKVALVTGASSGIGEGIAARFSQEGAHVAVNYRERAGNKEKVEAALAKFVTPGIPVVADVSKREDVERMVAQVVEKFGRLDIVVSNAGMEIKTPFLEVPDEEWDKQIGVNLYGSFVTAQASARQMVKQGGGGKIIFMSSIHEDVPFPQYTPYCVAKGGMRMLMRNIALELAPHRINCNNIAPGAIATPINRDTLNNPATVKEALAEIPWGRFGTTDDVASLTVFLASDESDYITGSTYYIDGGNVLDVTRY
jgi:glucose 1-dehydrogenase